MTTIKRTRTWQTLAEQRHNNSKDLARRRRNRILAYLGLLAVAVIVTIKVWERL